MTDLHSVSITKSFALNELVMREAANLEVVVVAIERCQAHHQSAAQYFYFQVGIVIKTIVISFNSCVL